ncbi:AraC family transcriptional regulator [Paenibacillus swuensis]|uniref:AraC family transcriptional regulator n=2 Tax=Paenibacillus swuensis TaxID=1178515 RepID=A0A172TP76_9BACL|nr:AraC family transcriptional regulator [Paenibacillus swuensis]
MQWQQPIEIQYRVSEPLVGAQFHSHAFYEIYYFHSGDCNYLIGDQLMKLQTGDLILMHGMTLHSPHPSLHVPYVRSILHFDPAYLFTVLRPEKASELLQPFEELQNIRLSLEPSKQAELEKTWGELSVIHKERIHEGGSEDYGRFTFRFFELLQLIRHWCTQPVRETAYRSQKEEHVQHVITFLEQHYAKEITLDQIAEALHLTKPYLSHMFKEVTGTTVFKYLYNRRINQAKMMFRLHPEQSVTDVYKAVGFEHAAHFSRMFTAVAGCNPAAYRKKMKEETDGRGRAVQEEKRGSSP